MTAPVVGQASDARENHISYNGLVVYAQDTGRERGRIDAEAFDIIVGSPSTPENVKRNLLTGVQWAIITPDGGLGVVGPGFECVRNPDMTAFPQCDNGDNADNPDRVAPARQPAPVAAPAPAPAPAAKASVPRVQPPLTRIAAASGKADAARDGLVAFVSTDGSATIGSRSVFILRNVQSGESVLIPVRGNGAGTLTKAFVQPGTYDVIAPAPSVDGYKTYVTRDISETRITIARGGVPQMVAFSLDTQIAPVVMQAAKVTANTVTLDWGALAGVTVRGYTIVRTDGDRAAASETAGVVVVANVPGTTSSVEAQGLAANRKYTFTLFATASDGSKLPTRSVTVSTARVTGGTQSSYAVAPNTITPQDFASLRAEAVSETSVRVALPANVTRSSSSNMPGLADGGLRGNGCVVGTPFLVTTDVAGDKSFYGLIDACEGSGGAASAIVNRDVPLSAVFDYFRITTDDYSGCYDTETGKELPGGVAACRQISQQTPTAGAAPSGNQQSGVASAPPPGSATLPFDQQTDLVREQRYWSQSGSHYLVFQNDGNLVVYRADGGYVWGLDRQPNTDFRRIGRVTWQADGNLAAYTADNQYIWSALTRDPDAGARLLINPQGVLQIVRGGQAMWSASNPQASLEEQTSPSGAAPVVPAQLAQQDHGHAAPAEAAAFSPAGGFAVPVANISQMSPADYASRFSAYGAANPITPWHEPAVGYAPGVVQAAAMLGYGQRAPDHISLAPSRVGPPLGVAMMAAASSVSCDTSGKAVFTPGMDVSTLRRFDFELAGIKLKWNIEAGVVASVNPLIDIEGKASCSVDIPGITIPIGGAAIPFSVRLKPEISAEAAAQLLVKGPSVALELGVSSKGMFGIDVEICSKNLWLTTIEYPCGADVVKSHTTSPIARFTRGDAEINVSGTLTFRAGVDVNLGFGYDIGIAKARTGFSLILAPFSAEFKAQVGTNSCVAASVGYQIEAALVTEAYLPLILDEEERLPLYESGHKDYPGAKFMLGDCGDDDEDEDGE
ncbi:MAG: fibronectin type III domain-containing protein [Porphyrobacter sp.]|nr:fibronectin type III domain-containing protein [Porphyrobacter sp.]